MSKKQQQKPADDQERPAELANASLQGQAVVWQGPAQGQRKPAGTQGQRAGEGRQMYFYCFFKTFIKEGLARAGRGLAKASTAGGAGKGRGPARAGRGIFICF